MLDVILQYAICVYTVAIHRHVPAGRQRICLFLVSLWEESFFPYISGRIVKFPLSKVAVMCYRASNVWAKSAGEGVPSSPLLDEDSTWLKERGSRCLKWVSAAGGQSIFCADWGSSEHPQWLLSGIKHGIHGFNQKVCCKRWRQVILQQKDVVSKRCL